MKKSYKGFVIWLLVYTAGCILPVFLPLNGETVTKLILLYTAAMMALLAYIVYKTDSIYWYNGVAFEEAEAAGYERRSEYAYKHLVVFGWFAAIYTAYTAISLYLNINIFIDSMILTISLIVAAVFTMKIKL